MGPQSTTPTTPTPRRAFVLRTAVSLLLATPLAAQRPATTPLLQPSAIAYDAQGNLYIAEASRHDIRKLNTTGNITTIAGTGVQGFSGDNGSATTAELNSPRGLAIAPNGNIYVADTSNHRIREISAATGIITTIAGTGTAGRTGDNGPATAARLDLPTALATDASGNLYIADTANHRIREIGATTGIITTIAGTGTQGYSGDNGPATSAQLDSPQGLAIDTSGNLYIADTNNHCIREVKAATGIIATIAGTGAAGNSGDGGAATAAALTFPRGLSLDTNGNLYLADFGGQRIRKLNAATGRITTVAGSDTQGFNGDGGPATAATLDSPRATAISPSGLVTLADAANQRIRQIDASGAIHTIAGPGTVGPTSPANTPVTIALSASSTSITAGQPVTITAKVSTATGTPAGSPTGTVTLYDNAVALATIPVPPSGQITYSTAALASGTNTLTASYSGDTNFAKSTSSPATVAVNTISGTTTGSSDFALTAKDSTTQTLLSGASASFTFTLQTEGAALSSPITLSASGVPSLYTASFNPAYLPPGAASGTVTLTIAAKTTNALQKGRTTSGIFVVLLFPLTLFGIRHRNRQRGYSKDSSSPVNCHPEQSLSNERRSRRTCGLLHTTVIFSQIRDRDTEDTGAITSKGQRPALYQPGAKPQVHSRLNRQRAEGPTHRFCRYAAIFLLLLTGCGARINTAGQNTHTATPYAITVTGTATTPAGTTIEHSTIVTLLIQPSN